LQKGGIKNYLSLVLKRARLEGFSSYEFSTEFPQAIKQLTEWHTEGKLKTKEDIQEGFENIPDTFLRLFNGSNVGKQLLKLNH